MKNVVKELNKSSGDNGPRMAVRLRQKLPQMQCDVNTKNFLDKGILDMTLQYCLYISKSLFNGLYEITLHITYELTPFRFLLNWVEVVSENMPLRVLTEFSRKCEKMLIVLPLPSR